MYLCVFYCIFLAYFLIENSRYFRTKKIKIKTFLIDRQQNQYAGSIHLGVNLIRIMHDYE